MQELSVQLGQRSYPIYIGAGLLGRAGLYRPHIRGRDVMIVTNTTVGPLYLERCRAALDGFRVDTVVLPDGEQYKTLEYMERIVTALLEARFDRHCTLLALGGGVIGDITGFAAACYQRGVDFIQVPTTLLAQVDSSVGGKTAVNHPLGKNMIGAFHQPRAVLIDIDVLATLPPREFAAGMAEVLKYGFIRDVRFLSWLEARLEQVQAREVEPLVHAIECSCRNKAEVVAADEREAGERALLNLGHTFGHAIETGLGYGQWLHGEAVAAGTMLAAELSVRIGLLDPVAPGRVATLLERAGLPVHPPPALAPERMLELMAVDKKVQDGRIRLVLLEALGRAVVSADYPPSALRETLVAGHAAARAP